MPWGNYDISGGILRGAQLALSLEQLGDLKRKREEEESISEAVSSSMVPTTPITSKSESGLNINLGTEQELDTEEYAKKLDSISPEKASAYRKSLLDIDTAKTKLESDELKLTEDKRAHPLKMEIITQQAMTTGWDYFKATGDDKGASSIVNKYVGPEDQVQSLKPLPNGNVQVIQKDGDVLELDEEKMMMLGRSKDAQMNAWIELTKSRESITAKADKNTKPKAPRSPTMQERKDQKIFLLSFPEFSKMDKTELDNLSIDVSKGIIDLQTKAVNDKEQPPSTEEAREVVLGELMNRIIPAEEVNWGFDKPAQYFTSPEAVLEAAKKKKITKTQAENILKKGFPKWYKKKQEELTNK